MTLRTACLVAGLTVAPSMLAAQTTLSPDISAVGDFRAYSHDDSDRNDESEKLNLADPAMELVIGGYLNPYARADAVIGWHGEDNAEIEEVYATILRGLPLGMNLRAGKYLLEFGRLNPVHEHAWSFVERPLPHTSFFGNHGLSDMTIRASFLLPTGDAYTELMLGLTKGDALTGHNHDHDADEHEEVAEPERYDPGFFARLTTSLAASENGELAFGASALNTAYGVAEVDTGLIDPEPEQLRSWLAGLDLKYKHKPSRYTSLQIEAEGLMRSDELDDGDRLKSYGGYGYVDYRFRQKYNLGGIFEFVRQKEVEHHHDEAEHEEHHILKADTWRAGLFAGFAPIEETSLVRLAAHWTEPENADGFWEITTQFVFSLGPHQPHNF